MSFNYEGKTYIINADGGIVAHESVEKERKIKFDYDGLVDPEKKKLYDKINDCNGFEMYGRYYQYTVGSLETILELCMERQNK